MSAVFSTGVLMFLCDCECFASVGVLLDVGTWFVGHKLWNFIINRDNVDWEGHSSAVSVFEFGEQVEFVVSTIRDDEAELVLCAFAAIVFVGDLVVLQICKGEFRRDKSTIEVERTVDRIANDGDSNLRIVRILVFDGNFKR